MIIFTVYMIGMFFIFGVSIVKGPGWLEREQMTFKDWAEVFMIGFLMAMIWPLISIMMAIRIADNFIDRLDRD